MRARVLIGISGICSIFSAGFSCAEDNSPVVLTYAEHQGGNVVYHYEIRATETQRFFVGCDCQSSGIGLPQLQAAPVNARALRTDNLVTWYELPSEAAQQPPGWRVRMAQPLGTSGYWIEWYRPAPRANAGATERALTGFAIVVPGSDDAYLTGHYTIELEGNRPAVSGTLSLLDTTPPTLTLEARTVRGAADVQIVATAKDDLDPEPLVVAESIRTNPSPQDPGYAVAYSATDASGNRSVARIYVPVPLPGKPTPSGPTVPKTRNLPRLALLP